MYSAGLFWRTFMKLSKASFIALARSSHEPHDCDDAASG